MLPKSPVALSFAHRMQLVTSRLDGLRCFDSVFAYLPPQFQHIRDEGELLMLL